MTSEHSVSKKEPLVHISEKRQDLFWKSMGESELLQY